MDKYKRFLALLNDIHGIQIFLTGSILDKDAYEEVVSSARYLPYLSESNRLLNCNKLSQFSGPN